MHYGGTDGDGFCVVDDLCGSVRVAGGVMHNGPQQCGPALDDRLALRRACAAELAQLHTKRGGSCWYDGVQDAAFPWSDSGRADIMAAAGVFATPDDVIAFKDPDAAAVRAFAVRAAGVGSDALVAPTRFALLGHLFGAAAVARAGVDPAGIELRGVDFSRPATAVLVKHAHRGTCQVVLHRGDLQIIDERAFWCVRGKKRKLQDMDGRPNPVLLRCIESELWSMVRTLRHAAGADTGGAPSANPSVALHFSRLAGLHPAVALPSDIKPRRDDFERIVRTPPPQGKAPMKRRCTHSDRQSGSGPSAMLQCRPLGGCAAWKGNPDAYPHSLWINLYRDLRAVGVPVQVAAADAKPACLCGGYRQSGERFDAARIVQAVAAELTPDEQAEVLRCKLK